MAARGKPDIWEETPTQSRRRRREASVDERLNAIMSTLNDLVLKVSRMERQMSAVDFVENLAGMVNCMTKISHVSPEPEVERSPGKGNVGSDLEESRSQFSDDESGFKSEVGSDVGSYFSLDEENAALLSDPWQLLENMVGDEYPEDYTKFVTEQVTHVCDSRPLAGASIVQKTLERRMENEKVIRKLKLIGREFTFDLLGKQGLASPGLVVEVIDEQCVQLSGYGGQSYTTASNCVSCRDCSGSSWSDAAAEPTTDHRNSRCYGRVTYIDLPVKVVGYKEWGDG